MFCRVEVCCFSPEYTGTMSCLAFLFYFILLLLFVFDRANSYNIKGGFFSKVDLFI